LPRRSTGKQRSEEFLAHEWILTIIHCNHGWGDATLLSADFAANQDSTFRPCCFQQSFQSLELLFIDDLPELIGCQWIFPVHRQPFVAQRIQEVW
jgi:hypothetical protein